MALASFLLMVCAFTAQTSVSRLLPTALKVLAPCVGWCVTCTALCHRFPVLFGIVQGSVSISALLALTKMGASCVLAQRSLYFPAASGLVSIALAQALRHFKVRFHTVALVVALLVQLWATAGGAVMLAVYPASVVQVIEPQAAREARYRHDTHVLTNTQGKTVERSVIYSYNGLLIDTVIVKPARQRTNRWLVYFGGNAEFLENSMDSAGDLGNAFGANVVLYNPRGVGRSNGFVTQVSDLVEDAAAVTQYVVKREKIDPRRLVLLGHSIGGGVAAQVALRVFPEATLVLDRTFSSLTDAAIRFSPLTPGVTAVVFPILVGDLNAMEAWNGLSHERKLVLFSRHDEIISYTVCSIARLPQFRPGARDAKRVIELTGVSTQCHNTGIMEFREGSAVSSYVKHCLGE